MTSQIDPTKPTNTHAFTDDVRDNFGFAKSEIEALQNAVSEVSGGPYLSLLGGQMDGVLELAADPVGDLDAASKRWVIANAATQAPVHSVAGRGGDVTLVHTDITDWATATAGLTPTYANIVGGLGYIPYDKANPAHYQTDAQLAAATALLYPRTNPSNYQTDAQLAAAVAPLYPTANPANYQTDAQVSATVSTSVNAAVLNYVPLSQKGALNGVASLDATGVVPTTQLPGAVTGTLTYLGGWNAATNTPTLASGALSGGTVQAAGRYYLVTVGATTAAIDGQVTWVSGDWVSSNGTVWQRVQNSTSPYLPLAIGGNVTGPITATSLQVQSDTWTGIAGYSVNVAWSLRDSTGGIPLAVMSDGSLMAAAVMPPTTPTMPVPKSYVDTTFLPIGGGVMQGPFGVRSNAVFDQAIDLNLMFSVRDASGGVAFAIEADGSTRVANLRVTGQLYFPQMTVDQLTYADLVSSGPSASDWVNAYDWTISDGHNIAGGLLRDGRLRLRLALETQTLNITGTDLASAYQLDPCVADIQSCAAGGGVQLKRNVGSVWYIQNSNAQAINIWPAGGAQIGSSPIGSGVTVEPGSAVILWQTTIYKFGIAQAGAGGGGSMVFTGTGFANPRDMRDRVADSVNVNDLVAGIDATGVTDNSVQIKAAHDLAYSLGYRYMRFPARAKIHAPFGIAAGNNATALISNVMFVGEKCTIDTYRKVIADPDSKPFVYPIDDLTPIMMEPFTAAVKAATTAAPAHVVIMGHSGVDANQRNGQGGGLTGVLSQKLEKVYGNRPIRVSDRSIGGSGWIDMARNGPPSNAYGNDANNPTWWAQWYETQHPGQGYTRRWIEYARDLQPVHAIFISQGANDNKNFDIYCMQAFIDEIRARFSPVPQIFLIADYGRQLMSTFTGTWDIQESMDYCAGYQRTYCRRNGIGFFDFGRGMAVLRDGFDPVGGRLVNFIDGFPEENNNQLTTTLPWTFPSNQQTYHFSYRIGPAGNMNAVFGTKKMITQIGADAENILILEQDVATNHLAYTVQSINTSNTLKYGRDPTWPPPTAPYNSVPRTVTSFDLSLTGTLSIELDIRDSLMFLSLTSKSGTQFTQPVVSIKQQVDRYGGYFLPSIRWDTGVTSTVNVLQAAKYVPDTYVPQMTDFEFLDYTLHINPYGMSRMWVPIIDAARFV